MTYIQEGHMVHMKRWLSGTAILGAVTFFQTASPVYGSGFGIFTQGASALGQADAVVAHNDGPSAIFFNPALLNKLAGTQVEAGTTLLFPSRDFRSSTTGATASTEDNFYYPSTFYVSHTFNDKLSAGLGVFNPFGLGTEWNGTWEGRYIATNSKIETFNVNPVISYQITPDLSFAAGLDVLLLNATLENKVNLGVMDANQKLKGDGTGFGYNLGVAYNAGHGISLGASYRSEVDIDVKGTVSLNPPVVPNIGAKTTITLPRQLFAGVAYQPTDRLVIETGFRWEDWRSYESSKVELAGLPTATTPKNWHDTFAVNVGGKYRLNDTFTLLGGYLYGWNAVPDDTFEPAVPDANTHLFCLGTDMEFTRIKLAVSYAYQLQEERSKINTVGANVGGAANGIYNADIHLLGLSVTYRF